MVRFITLIALVLFVSFGEQPITAQSESTSSCVEQYDETIDYFPDKVDIQFASGFAVEYEQNYKVVQINLAPPQDYGAEEASNISETYVLVQCGTPAPELTGQLAEATLIEVPVRSVAVWYEEEAAFLEALNATHTITAIGGNTYGGNSYYSQVLNDHIQQNDVALLGYPPSLETLVEVQPDIAFFFTQVGVQFDQLLDYRRVGINAVPNSSYIESTPLGKAEWIKFFSLFLNAEATANEVFGEVEQHYNELVETAAQAATHPNVILSAASTNPVFVLQNGWQAELVEDAAATNLFGNEELLGDASAISLEAFVEIGAEADYWIVSYDAAQLYTEFPAALNEVQAFRTDNVYDLSGRVGMNGSGVDFFEMGAVRPDLILEDMIAIFHPELLPNHELFFLRKYHA